MLSRSQKINLEKTTYYHCVTRCVRRAFLFGTDPLSNKNYDHRKEMIVERLKFLSKYFSIDICAYAIMSNHVHLVLHVDIDKLKNLTDKEVLELSKVLYPTAMSQLEYLILENKLPKKIIDIKIAELRERLGSISWFMRSLNEYLARVFNKEDKCTGRFWEGRFKSQALLDERAILSAMAYVDLNPIRANMVDKIEDYEYTSIYERLNEVQKDISNKVKKDNFLNDISEYNINKSSQPSWLMPLKNIIKQNERSCLNITVSEYLTLVEDTGRFVRKDINKGYIKPNVQNFLTRIKINATKWVDLICNMENYFFRAVGSFQNLKNYDDKSRIFGGLKSKEFFI